MWSAGGKRGLCKTTDGGGSWTRVRHISDDTGISDIVFQPGKPDVIYASAYPEPCQPLGAKAPTGAAAAQYYHELYVDPYRPDWIWSVDTSLGLSKDGGKTWSGTEIENYGVHVDHHAIEFDPIDPKHM